MDVLTMMVVCCVSNMLIVSSMLIMYVVLYVYYIIILIYIIKIMNVLLISYRHMEPSRSVVGVVGTGRVKLIVVRTTIITIIPAAVLAGEVRKIGLLTRQKAEFRLFQKERFHKVL